MKKTWRSYLKLWIYKESNLEGEKFAHRSSRRIEGFSNGDSKKNMKLILLFLNRTVPQSFDKLRTGNTSDKVEGSFSTEPAEVFGTNGDY